MFGGLLDLNRDNDFKIYITYSLIKFWQCIVILSKF